MSEETTVVVIGRYAGVIAANRLTQRDDLHSDLDQPAPARVVLAGLRNLEIGMTL